MNNIKRLIKLLPIYIDNKELNIITYADYTDYINILKSEWYSINLTCKFNKMSIQKLNYIVESSLQFYNGISEHEWAARLVLKDKNDIYSGITVADIENGDIEIAYWTKPEYQHMGISTSCVKAVKDLLMNNDFNFNNIIIQTMHDNIASKRVAEKCGFELYSRLCTENIKVYGVHK